ncbi:MAG: c-type cytochrome [Verrucomicrobiia bacterium]
MALLINMPQCGLLKKTAAIFCFLIFINLAHSISPEYLSPSALAKSPDEKTIYIACATAPKIIAFDVNAEKISKIFKLKENPNGIAVSKDGRYLFVTCPSPQSSIYIIESESGKIVNKMITGHSACSPVISPDGTRLYVANQFNNSVSEMDIKTGKEIRRFNVAREPVSMDISADGKLLLVANHLPAGRADSGVVAAVIEVVDIISGKAIKQIQLPNGSTSVNSVKISPDGKYACVTHLLARFRLPTTQLDRGWMNTNAKTLIDLKGLKILNTVLLDNVDKGAANPWGTCWSADGKYLCIAHSGTHEISVIKFPELIDKLMKLPADTDKGKIADYITVSRSVEDVPNDLSFLVGLRNRIKLPESDKGPRAITIIGSRVYVANYFSDSISVLELNTQNPQFHSVKLASEQQWTTVRLGEFYFHDATICFQGWQSCSSCHPGDARVDGLNWDLMNDGIGNPKNTRSLLLSHKTPPAMSLGVRETAYTAVRAGIRHILFSAQPESVANSIDEYLKSLKSVPSPYLVNGSLSKSAARGKKIFNNAGCSQCHPQGLFTDMRQYDVGTKGETDKPQDLFDTPTLIEVWRTGPYLHDGSAATIKELFTVRNKDNKHGITQNLTEEQINDLVEYVLSL